MEKYYSKEDILKLKKIARIIASTRKNGKKLNRYDYYMLGGIPLRKSDKVLSLLHSKGLLTATEANYLYKYTSNELVFGASRNKEFILGTKYQFGNIIISDLEKQNIWLELNKMGLSDDNIDDLVFAAAVRDYAKKNGLISNIKKIVKKK